MKTWLIFGLFVGLLLVLHGIYEEKLEAQKRNVKVEYRFVPRTFYEEQLMNAENSLSDKFKNMFEGSNIGL
jgi:hypothetical protein